MNGKITLPGSKSITNRLILLASLSKNRTVIRNFLSSDDTNYMVDALKKLGVEIQRKENELIVDGVNQTYPVKSCDLFLGNAGTAFRPLTAVLSMMSGEYNLSGIKRMHERPIKDLVETLKKIGASIEYTDQSGFPPLKIMPLNKAISHNVSIKGNVSSQFLSSMLMAIPLLRKPFSIEVEGDLISKPYVDITLKLLEKFGVHYQNHNWKQFTLQNLYAYENPTEINVEGDASSASYFFGAAAIAGKVEVIGLNKNSIQGDIKFLDVIESMGAIVTYKTNSIIVEKAKKLKGSNIDCKMIPDAAMTLATMALFCDGVTRLDNIASWKVKETDRIKAMHDELRKLGADIKADNNSISITPPKKINNNIEIDTYDDHRMAMCFSLVTLKNNKIILNDPDCVNKTYPNFFKDFEKITQ